MEKNQTQPNESLQVANFDPATVYAGASTLTLSKSEMKALCAPFEDLEYEIRPDGYIYLPQAVGLKRLNDVIGIGRWGLLLINGGKDDLGNNKVKVFFDGAMVIRNCFVSRSVGESQYNRTNANQSWASAFEAAKTDCRQRCCKDLGIANDAWNPTFIRRWQKEHAIKVFVVNQRTNEKEVAWRRKDVDPFWNEAGLVPTSPTVPIDSQNNSQKPKSSDLPWLNHGPDYDAALRDLKAGYATIDSLKVTKYKISRETEKALIEVLSNEWRIRTDACPDMLKLTALYTEHKGIVDHYDWLRNIFNERRDKLKMVKV